MQQAARLPDFFVIGAAKCGTTSLCAALNRHPDIFISTPKEPNFLSFDDVYSNGWDWYAELFAEAASDQMLGEGSVAYANPLYDEKVIDRIKRNVPAPKFIYIVRHPMERIRSAWRELCTNGFHSGDDEFRWKNLPRSLTEALKDERSTLIAESRYFERASQYLEHFPMEDFHFLFLEEYSRNEAEELQKCFAFLGARPFATEIDTPTRQNTGDSKRRDTGAAYFLRNHAPQLMRYGGRIPVVGKLARDMLRKPVATENLWDEETYDLVKASVRQDSARFLEMCGRETSYWDL